MARTSASTRTEDRIDPAVLRVAVALIVGSLAVSFDTTIVTVALRTLAVQLDASVATIQWVSTGYLLALGVSISLAGWAQVRYGGRRVWLSALAVFLVGSVLCSLAGSAATLIAFRVVQGLGGGLLLPLFSTLVLQAAGGRALGRTMSVVTLPFVVGPILGPVIGGALVDGLGWRWLFWVNVPFCVVGLALARRRLDEDATGARPRFDTVGWLLLSAGLVAVLLGLSDSARPGGFRRTDALGPLLAGAVLLAVFTAYAARRAGALVDVRLLRHRPLAAASALTLLSGAGLYGGMVLLPLYFQDVRAADTLHAGLLLAPQGIGALLSRPLAGGLSDRIGPRWVAFTGFAIVGVATVPFALATATTGRALLMAVLLVRGFGLAAVTIPLSAAAFIGLSREQIPDAGVLTRIAQQIGGSLGVAVLAALLDAALRDPGPQAAPAARTAAAFDQAFWWAVGFTAVALALSLILPGRSPQPAPTTAEDPDPVLVTGGNT